MQPFDAITFMISHPAGPYRTPPDAVDPRFALIWRTAPAPSTSPSGGHEPPPTAGELLDRLRADWSPAEWTIGHHPATARWIACRGDTTLVRTDPIALRAALEGTSPPRPQ